ncbi:g4364 [Coccomyxa viridis]|uniref:G4364 protein n=1 Tax=Coccomyxa viridis TaxID=1274662 RepID=A0ABP1FQ35_9CHLO
MLHAEVVLEGISWMDVDGEVALLVRKITELGQKDATDGNMRVKYGVLFRETSDDFEALAGTMRAAKKKGLIAFDGELLLQGVHDNVDVILLNGCSKA